MSNRATSSTTATRQQHGHTQTTQHGAHGKQGTVSTVQVPHDKIAMRAYEKWCKRGCPHGSDKQDWYEAEKELRTELAQKGSTQGGTSRR